MTGLLVWDRTKRDEVAHRPMVRQLKILVIKSMQADLDREVDEAQCADFPAGMTPVMIRASDLRAEGGCPEEENRAKHDIACSPVKITFQPAP